MKNCINYILLIVFCLVIFQANSIAQSSIKTITGVWIVETPEAPLEYSRGNVTFSEIDGKLTAKIQFPNQQVIPVNEIKTKDKKVIFSLIIEGYLILVELDREGDKMTGKVETPEGTLKVKSERVKK